VLEGLHALKHALRFDAEVLDARTPDPGALRALADELATDVAERIAALAEPVDDATFETLAPSPHPTGVIALATRPGIAPADVLALPGPAPVVLLERPTHHGNIGAVVRVAAAAGAAGVLTTGRHDPWHPASLRGGAGLQFALPVASLEPDGVDAVLATDRPLVALDPDGEAVTGPGAAEVPGGRSAEGAGLAEDTGQAGASSPIPARAVLVFGSERTGVSDALLRRVDYRVAIPMRPGVSSLNLATAVAITLYAAGGWTAFS
jgi:TrmH family RNA methyltransferase